MFRDGSMTLIRGNPKFKAVMRNYAIVAPSCSSWNISSTEIFSRSLKRRKQAKLFSRCWIEYGLSLSTYCEGVTTVVVLEDWGSTGWPIVGEAAKNLGSLRGEPNEGVPINACVNSPKTTMLTSAGRSSIDRLVFEVNTKKRPEYFWPL
jgi:hypothetical protein